MDARDEVADLRKQVLARRQRSRFSLELASRICAYVAARRAGGATMRQLARELGIAMDTLYRWRRDAPAFRAVEVVAPPSATALTVRGPRGLRVEGLDLAAVAELWRQLE